MSLESPSLAATGERLGTGDVARFWRVPRYRDLECLRATFRRHAYTRHTHETYAVAAVLEGCETFFHRGEQHYAGPGSLAVVCPDELHDGEPHGGGFVYRTIYPSVELMREIAEEVAGRQVTGMPWFRHSVMSDPALAAGLARLHASLDEARLGPPDLAVDENLVAFLAHLITRWSDLDGVRAPACASAAVARARDYLDAHATEDVDLIGLAAVAGLSRAHLIRAFRREVGLTPHTYQTDRRFREACRRLSRGEPPADVAAACGFCDQSHLNRVFKARMGVAPGAFRAA